MFVFSLYHFASTFNVFHTFMYIKMCYCFTMSVRSLRSLQLCSSQFSHSLNLFLIDHRYLAYRAYNKKAVLSQGNRTMPQLFFSV